MSFFRCIALVVCVIFVPPCLLAKPAPARFKVIAFYTGKHDQAHVSFVKEANEWFPKAAARHRFTYEATSDWTQLNPEVLSKYQVVLFLDTRPEDPAQRAAFRNFMEQGGAFLGFHFSAFALTPSTYPQDWDWYHKELLGSESYQGNTWRPTSAILKVEAPKHPVARQLPATFKASPNEWYSWTGDLRNNPDIQILLSIHPRSFPLGTGPKAHEIWTRGDYPVAWTHRKYRMLYVNMGHNDIDYEGGTNRELSFTFENEVQNRFILDGLRWLGRAAKRGPLGAPGSQRVVTP